jgi:hypothetical protein
MSLEDRLAALEQRVATLEGVEGVRRALSLYARGVDERRTDLLEQLFAEDCHLQTVPWGADTRGRARVLLGLQRYWERFQHPRRYYANENIRVDGDRATAFTYWFVTQDDRDRSVIGWGTYEWAFRLEGGAWRATELIIRVLTMTTLDRGWAIPDKVMMPFERPGPSRP